MKQRYLEVTFRKGKPFAAYLYLPRATGARVSRTDDAGHGIHIDFDDQGRPLGVEITSPANVSMSQLNSALARHGIAALDEQEWRPLAA